MKSLLPERVASLLRTERLGRNYQFLLTCGSTNDVAAELARGGAADGTVVVADHQEGGRGRLGRAWHSPPGLNLYASIILRPKRPPAEVPPLTLLAGAALARALQPLGVQPLLKWPNDVLLSTPAGLRKTAGILTEMASERDDVRHVVVGIGVNVNLVDLPEEIAARATSLGLVLGQSLDRGALLADLLAAFEDAYRGFEERGPQAAIAAWRPFAAWGLRCRVDATNTEPAFEGWLRDLDDGGHLIVEDERGHVRTVVSGDVTVV